MKSRRQERKTGEKERSEKLDILTLRNLDGLKYARMVCIFHVR